MTRRREAFLDFYFGIAKLNAMEAARLSGFRQPRVAGSALLRTMRDVVEERMLALKNERIVGPDEVLEILASMARDVDHKDRLGAVTLLAKINGQLSDKLVLSIDRKQLAYDLEAELTRPQLPPALGSEPKSQP